MSTSLVTRQGVFKLYRSKIRRAGWFETRGAKFSEWTDKALEQLESQAKAIGNVYCSDEELLTRPNTLVRWVLVPGLIILSWAILASGTISF